MLTVNLIIDFGNWGQMCQDVVITVLEYFGYHTITFQLCFSTYFFVILKIRIKFAVADRIAEAPVWGLERRDAET